MPFDFGVVVLVPFPFTNQLTSKQRPAVIVSQPAYARACHDVVLMAIMSQVRTATGICRYLANRLAECESA